MKSFCLRLFVVLFITSIWSCNNDNNNVYTSTDTKLYNFEQQGWKSQQITHFINDVNYTATEVPIQYYILKHVGKDVKKIDSIYNSSAFERVIEIEFQHSDKKDLLLEEFTQKSYEESVKYMAFKIENDFTIVTSSNDTLKCSGAQFERNYKIAPFKRALLYFNNVSPNDHIKLIYNDNLFGNGIIKFNFQKTPLKL